MTQNLTLKKLLSLKFDFKGMLYSNRTMVQWQRDSLQYSLSQTPSKTFLWKLCLERNKLVEVFINFILLFQSIRCHKGRCLPKGISFIIHSS